ncbi:hypothetical protein [Chelativorans petroleitrophicus]|mgnify:FL=1|jgi:hypothetical protein
MRFLLAVLAAFGLYHFLRPQRTGGPKALLRDMRRSPEEDAQEDVVYKVVEHDGGWAYRVGDVFSEAFVTREEATAAAEQAAAAHRSRGAEEELIQYQDRRGRWHEEVERGDDRPRTHVEPPPAAGA